MAKKDSTIIKLQLSFVFMIILLLIVAAVGIGNTSIVHDKLESVSSMIHTKVAYTTDMRDSAKDRTLHLQQMVLLDDPFAIDEQWMLFNRQGGEFAEKRLALLGMQLNEHEKQMWARQTDAAARVVPVQRRIAELAMQQDKATALALLTHEAIPIQNEMFAVLNEMYDYYDQLLVEERREAEEKHHEIVSISVFAAAMAVMLALISSIWITKRIRKYQHNLHELNNSLEGLVDERTNKLKDSEGRQKNIVDNAIEGIITVSPAGVIQSYNPAAARIFGFGEHEVIGVSLCKLIYLECDEHDFNVRALIGTENEFAGRTKDGRELPLLVGTSEILYQGRSNYSFFVRDITEQKRVDRLKNEFISTVSHELRTPITSIRGSLGLLLGGAVGPLSEKVQELVQLAYSNCERLLKIINDILDIQKIESGMMDFKLSPLDLTMLLRQAVEENQGYAEQFGVKLEVDNLDSPAFVMGDEVRLQQVLGNLISNAIKFSPNNEVVCISLSSTDDGYKVAVADHGPGISEEFQGKMFDKFTQEDNSSTRLKGGTGLGLSIVTLILEKHLSRLEFVTQVNQGTTFFFELKGSQPPALQFAAAEV